MWSVKCGVWGGEWRVESAKSEVWSGERVVWRL